MNHHLGLCLVEIVPSYDLLNYSCSLIFLSPGLRTGKLENFSAPVILALPAVTAQFACFVKISLSLS